jgi:hypothetical protein
MPAVRCTTLPLYTILVYTTPLYEITAQRAASGRSCEKGRGLSHGR